MKLQSLVAIFLIIVMPIVIVLSIYVDNLVDVSDKEARINQALINATYDAVRAYQMNTFNENYARSEITELRDLNASTSTLFNSLRTELFNSGYSRAQIEDYVPAILYTLYDGYYIYGASANASIDNGEDVEFSKDKILSNQDYSLSGKRYYSCEYRYDQANGQDQKAYNAGIKAYDLVINYTLDNYITVIGTYTTLDGTKKFIDCSGFYTLDNFSLNEPEILGEYISTYDEKRIVEDRRTHGYNPIVVPVLQNIVSKADPADFYYIGNQCFINGEPLAIEGSNLPSPSPTNVLGTVTYDEDKLGNDWR